MKSKKLGIWFPTVRCDTGTDVFTITLVEELNKRGIRAEITWLPLRAEYLPWSVATPQLPDWVTIVHVNTWLHPKFIPSNLPVVATLHHSIHDPELKPFKGFLRTQYHNYWIKSIERRTMQRVNKVVAVSQFAASITQQHVLDIPISVIYNGIDTEKFVPKENKIVNKPFQLLYVGSWIVRKGVDLLAPIMNELGEDYVLYYTGETTVNNQVNTPNNMIDIGRLNQEKIIRSMQTADALIFPTRSEGFGLVVTEAMACGLPVISSASSSMPEIISNGMTGFLCETNNVQSFIDSIRKLKESKELQAIMATTARYHAEKKFDISLMIQRYIETYEALDVSR